MTPTIVIIEDNESDVVLLRHALDEQGLGYEPLVITDGDAALGYVFDPLAAGPLPRLIVLDLNLPKRDGLEVLRAIHASPALVEVPVLVFTTSDSPSEQQTAEAEGVRAYIRKPLDLDGFLLVGSLIREICEEPRPANRR
ncbi:MAG: response regulator [Bryobacteraceae bacterium]